MISRVGPTRYVSAAAVALLLFAGLGYYRLASSASRFSPWFSPSDPSTVAPPGGSASPAKSAFRMPLHIDQRVWDDRALKVRGAFRHAYNSYRLFARGHDELRTLTYVGQDDFNGWNVSMYDALDTLYIMGLYAEFEEALSIVRSANFKEARGKSRPYVPFFETVIRHLGGLLAAYALSGEPVLLDKAEELATLLEPAFATTRGFPMYSVNPTTGRQNGGGNTFFAEIATCQMEWTYLGHASGKKHHFDKADNVINGLAGAINARGGGMFPTRWNVGIGRPISEDRSVSGGADSGHEYLLKQYLLTNKTDPRNLEMYILSTNEILTRLLYITPIRGLLYPTTTTGPDFNPTHELGQLACSLPGLLALGVQRLSADELSLDVLAGMSLGEEAQRAVRLLEHHDLRALHLAVAESLATTCWLSFKEMPSGLGAEGLAMDAHSTLWIDAVAAWHEGGREGPMPGMEEQKPIPVSRLRYSWKEPEEPWEYSVRHPSYRLRPEMIESLYIMWRVTGKQEWRQHGWEIFQAIEKLTKIPTGYATVLDVTDIRENVPHLADEMPSHFLAETLKYLYLLFVGDDPIPLDRFVFNAGAHPLPIFSWSGWEQYKFKIEVES